MTAGRLGRLYRKRGCSCYRCDDAKRAGFRVTKDPTPFELAFHCMAKPGTVDSPVWMVLHMKGGDLQRVSFELKGKRREVAP